jgi:hypothetical protein
MLVISAGVQKSGSALLFNLLNDLISLHGGKDVREIREQHHLEEVLLYHNCLVSDLSWKKLKRIFRISFWNTFVIKTHSGPSPFVKYALALGLLKVVLIVRDPRDIVLSAIDHGNRIRQAGESHTFASCDSIETTLPQVKKWIADSVRWLDCKNIVFVRYEDLMSSPTQEVARIFGYLKIPMSPQAIGQSFEKYQPANLGKKEQEFLHFNQAKVQRYKTVLTHDELRTINHYFAEEIVKFNYQV